MTVETVFVISVIATASGFALQAQATAANERVRRRILALEAQQAKIEALELERDRLRELDFAQGDALARASVSGTLPFFSPSFMALRQENQRIVDSDIIGIRTRKIIKEGNIAERLLISRNTARIAKISGLLKVGTTLVAGAAARARLFPDKDIILDVPTGGTLLKPIQADSGVVNT